MYVERLAPAGQDLVALFLYVAASQVSRKNSRKSYKTESHKNVERECYSLSVIFFLKMAKQTKGKITVDIKKDESM